MKESLKKDYLIFDWDRQSRKSAWRRAPWLIFFVSVSVLVHLGALVLFQVHRSDANPTPSGREEVHLTILEPLDADSSALQREIDDRLAPVWSMSRSSLAIDESLRNTVKFRPFFMEYQAEMKDLSPIPSFGKFPQVLSLGSAVYPLLPPLLATNASDGEAQITTQGKQFPSLQLYGDLAGLTIQEQLTWSDREMEMLNRQGSEVRAEFDAAVDSFGMVKFLIHQGSGSEELGRHFRDKLRNIRFVQETGRDLLWGRVVLTYEAITPPNL